MTFAGGGAGEAGHMTRQAGPFQEIEGFGGDGGDGGAAVPIQPRGWGCGIAHRPALGPRRHRQQFSAVGIDHSPFHPCAHPCSLAAGVREGIAAPPWLEGMPAGGS